MSRERTEAFIKLSAMPDGSPEIFTSVQGEGPKSGMLSLFVRLSECNLYCRWCDTPYTWRWDSAREHEDDKVYSRSQWQVKMSARELADEVRARGVKRVIFTGGEPLLQHRALLVVMKGLRETPEHYEFEFETNGTVAPPQEFLDLCSLIVVSPKLSNSGVEERARIVHALAALLRAPQTVLKFVVESDEDFEEIRDLQARFGVPSDRIWVMGQGRTAEAIARTGQAVIERVIASGYNYTARLHLSLFGDKQGT